MKAQMVEGINYLRPEEMSISMRKIIYEQELLFEDFFRNSKTRESAQAYFHGLISSIERKNSWQLAEQAGCKAPYSFQHLLGRSLWDENKLRDLSRNYTVDHLGLDDSIIAVDETGFLKKGIKSVGVARQYSGTAGRVENCQVGVFLSYSTKKCRALIDRELYIPEGWFEDKERCSQAGIPESLTFKKKPQLALEMLKRTFLNRIKPTWVVGDEVYGCHYLRAWLEENEQQYAMAVANNYPISIGLNQYKAKDFSDKAKPNDWKIISAGTGSKGERNYKWYQLKINSLSLEGWSRHLILRKGLKNNDDIAYYIAFTKNNTSLESTVLAIGSRWKIEECFEMAKGEVGLDQYEVRSWRGWYRHITLSMFSLSFLVKVRKNINQDEIEIKKKFQNQNQMQQFYQRRGLI